MIELVELLTMEKMTSLLTTCKQLFKADEITLYYAPKLWNSPDEVRKMLLAMTETKESRWRLSWVDTTRVAHYSKSRIVLEDLHPTARVASYKSYELHTTMV